MNLCVAANPISGGLTGIVYGFAPTNNCNCKFATYQSLSILRFMVPSKMYNSLLVGNCQMFNRE